MKVKQSQASTLLPGNDSMFTFDTMDTILCFLIVFFFFTVYCSSHHFILCKHSEAQEN